MSLADLSEFVRFKLGPNCGLWDLNFMGASLSSSCDLTYSWVYTPKLLWICWASCLMITVWLSIFACCSFSFYFGIALFGTWFWGSCTRSLSFFWPPKGSEISSSIYHRLSTSNAGLVSWLVDIYLVKGVGVTALLAWNSWICYFWYADLFRVGILFLGDKDFCRFSSCICGR